MVNRLLLLGQTLAFSGDPFGQPAEGAAQHVARGAVLIEDGRIARVTTPDDPALSGDLQRIDHGDGLILPGFIDAHMHYPQTAIIASWGKRLLDWLNGYTFPEEMRFGMRAYADEIAARYLDLALSYGTTTMCSYATTHPESVTAFFEAAEARGMRVLAGKTCMDRNAPAALCDTPQSAYEDSLALLRRWHGRGRLGYVITPRFAPTSSPDQLAALAALWAAHPDCLMQTHLSEQREEIDWVRGLFPQARDYLDIYEQAGLLGQRAVFGHAIHLAPREIDRLAESGAGLAHCPTSNSFIGSGLFDMAGLKARGLPVGLATDTGGGSSFSMLRSMAAAYEIAQLRGQALHPAQLLWLASGGAAKVLHLEDRVGHLAAGYEADLIVLDLSSTPAISQRAARAEDIWEALFPTIMMGDERAIAAVYIAGAPAASVSDR